MKFPLEACKLFLERQFGQDLVFPIYQWIVPCPKNKAQLIEWVDKWVADPKNFVDPVGSWDVVRITDFSKVFTIYRNRKLVYFDEELNWNMVNATTMELMFLGCRAFTGRGLKYWKVSNVTNMDGVFFNYDIFIGDVSEWDTSNVTNMRHMFNNCYVFNGDVSQWKVHNVRCMHAMFFDCRVFNGNVSGWDTSNVTDMGFMFYECHELDTSLEHWDVSSVQKVQNMLCDCKPFDKDCISQWNLSDNVRGVDTMFLNMYTRNVLDSDDESEMVSDDESEDDN